MVQIDPEKIVTADVERETRLGRLLEKNIDLLRRNVKNGLARGNGASLIVRFTGILETNDIKLTLRTNEKYSLLITQTNSTVSMFILASNLFALFSFSFFRNVLRCAKERDRENEDEHV